MAIGEINSSVAIFSLLYAVISLHFIFKTTEFVAVGLTIENIFEKLLNNENDAFIYYNIKRTSLTLIVHSFLPIGYIIGLSSTSGFNYFEYYSAFSLWWDAFCFFSIILPALSLIVVGFWSMNNWSNHPIAKTLALFSDNPAAWEFLGAEINSEFKRVDKIILRVSTITRVVVTDNWIIKCSPYGMFLNRQSESVLVLDRADTHSQSTEGPGTIQFVNIQVKPTRAGVRPFSIRCKALEFQDLQDKIHRPITILEGVKFHKSTVDYFLEVFREAVSHNPPYIVPPMLELEMCVGCLFAESNVKLIKNCSHEDSTCTMCYCKPMWCTDCMGRWFASRQEQDKPETWLMSSCTCPLCRSVFCILDVSPVILSPRPNPE